MSVVQSKKNPEDIMPVSGESVALLVGYSGSASDQQSEVK